LGKFDRKDSFLGIHIETFMPELALFRNFAGERLDALPKGVEKANLWLLPVAINAGANEDVEAAVYFASRNKNAYFDVNAIKGNWYDTICNSIERGAPLATRLTPDIITRAKARQLTLPEAAAILSFHNELPMFFGSRNYEDNFIYSSFFRSIEWLKIEGYEEWVDSYAGELSVLAQNGIEPKFVCWFLFYICRSDLALAKIERDGLNNLIWLMTKGSIDRDKPWLQYSWTSDFPEIISHLPLAASLVFAGSRVKSAAIKDDLIAKCIDVIFTMQKNSGGWPIKSDDPDAATVATCFAIHALATSKPKGWKKSCILGKNWLLEQQSQSGCWTISGAPTVMLTVLVLDAISLVDEDSNLTFGSSGSVIPLHPETQEEPDPVYDFSGVKWYGKDYPKTKSIAASELPAEHHPVIALVVAVETELRQTLLNLKPFAGSNKILKNHNGYETYYLGRFGAFNAVVMMCAMGSEGPGGSGLAVNALIQTWNPKAVVLEGIAFGIDKSKCRPGDVLVADMLLPYESQRVGEVTIPRSPFPPSSQLLLNRFKNTINWTFKRPDKSKVKKHVGAILTGGKLVDNTPFKLQLLGLYPNAIGGEMEGSGFWSAASRNGTPWILVKAVCDWGDGKKHKQYQELAAASAISLCLDVFKDPALFDGANP
jgi:nucleoside phosphorylase